MVHHLWIFLSFFFLMPKSDFWFLWKRETIKKLFTFHLFRCVGGFDPNTAQPCCILFTYLSKKKKHSSIFSLFRNISLEKTISDWFGRRNWDSLSCPQCHEKWVNLRKFNDGYIVASLRRAVICVTRHRVRTFLMLSATKPSLKCIWVRFCRTLVFDK